MDDVEKQLAAFGLNDKEIKVYLACIQLGTDTAFNIARRSSVKRATSYLVLDELSKKGLVTKKTTPKSLLYSPASPENFLLQLEIRKKKMEEVIPSLLSLYNNQPAKPAIHIFEGEEGVNQVYEEAIAFLRQGEEVIFYGSIHHLKKHPTLVKHWLQETKYATGKVRELLIPDDFHKEYALKIKNSGNVQHTIKIISENSGNLLNDNALFGNKMVIFSTGKTLYAIVIENKDITETYRTMFELAWRGSQDI